MKKKAKKKTAKKTSTRKKATQKEWGISDFVGSVWSVMEEQAEKNPSLKNLHARLEPEWRSISQKVTDLIREKDEAASAKITDEICSFGEKAVRPLIDVLLNLTEVARKRDDNK